MTMSEAYTNATQRIGPEREAEPDLNDCALVQDLLPLYLDHEVSPESHGRIANHIAQCERCANYLAGARSMRVQLLRDQQAVRATAPASAGPAVVHAQPMPNSTPNTLLPKLGRVLLAAAAIIGALILAPFLIPVAVIAAIPIGLFLIGRAIWNRLPQRLAGIARTGANRAMAVAVLSVLAALVCGGIILAGTAALLNTPTYYEQNCSVVTTPYPQVMPQTQASAPPFNGDYGVPYGEPRYESYAVPVPPVEPYYETYTNCTPGPPSASAFIQDRLVTILITLAGVVGLILLNQKRGWLPQYAAPSVVRQLIQFALIGAGVLAAVFVVQGVLAGTSVGLFLLFGGVVLGGLWWLRRKPQVI